MSDEQTSQLPNRITVNGVEYVRVDRVVISHEIVSARDNEIPDLPVACKFERTPGSRKLGDYAIPKSAD